MRSRFGISMWVALILAALGSAGIASAAGTPRLDYGRDVRPILSENCFHCHGQDSKQRMANLRLDSFERSEEHTSELQSHSDLVCRLLLEKKKKKKNKIILQ